MSNNNTTNKALKVALNQAGTSYPEDFHKLSLSSKQFKDSKEYLSLFSRLSTIFTDASNLPLSISYTTNGKTLTIDMRDQNTNTLKQVKIMRDFIESLATLVKNNLIIKYLFAPENADGGSTTMTIKFNKDVKTVEVFEEGTSYDHANNGVKSYDVSGPNKELSDELTQLYALFLDATKTPTFQTAGRLSITKQTRKTYKIPSNMNVLEAIQQVSKGSTKAKLADLLGVSKSTKLTKIELAAKVLTTNK